MTPWKATRRENPDDWGARSRIYGPETGVPGPRNPKLTPYAIPFARAVGRRRKKMSVLVTSAQSGKTESFLDIIGERLDNAPVPILYVGPSEGFNRDQFEPRLRDLFLQSKSLLSKIIGGIDGKRQKKTLKRVAGVKLRLASAGSSTALKSDAMGLALVDEYDEMLRNIKGQGDPLGLVVARGETYADFSYAVTSTPSQGLVEIELDPASGLEFWKRGDEDDIVSPIWKLWQRGTRHHWCWPCPHCHEYFVPRQKQLHYEKDATPSQAQRLSWLECPRCEGKIFEHHKEDLNARGRIVAPGQIVDRFGNVTGDEPDVECFSLWVSGLCSPFKSFGDRAHLYLSALESGDPAKIQTAINAGFGEVAAPVGGEAPDLDEILQKRVQRTKLVPDDVVSIVAGVDVQKFSLPFVIRGFGPRGTSWLIKHGALHGPTKDPRIWEELAELLTTPIEGHLIKLAFVDSGFRPGEKAYLPVNRVYEFCRKYRRFVFPTKGTSTPMIKPLIESAIEVNADELGHSKKYGLRLVRLDPNHWKSTVHERLGLSSDEPGCLHLNDDVDDDYCKQLVSETKVRGANGRYVWVKLQKANHYLDCEAMAAAPAFRLEADHFGPQAAERAADRPARSRSSATIISAAPRGSIRDRMGRLARRLNG